MPCHRAWSWWIVTIASPWPISAAEITLRSWPQKRGDGPLTTLGDTPWPPLLTRATSSPIDITVDVPRPRFFRIAAADLVVTDAANPGEKSITIRELTKDEAHPPLFPPPHMTAIGQLAAGVAHEINNPLTYVLANLDYIASAATEQHRDAPGDWHLALSEAQEGGQRIRTIVHNLQAFARGGDAVTAVAVEPVLRTAIETLDRAILGRARWTTEVHRKSQGHGRRSPPTPRIWSPVTQRMPSRARTTQTRPRHYRSHPWRPRQHHSDRNYRQRPGHQRKAPRTGL